MKRHAPLLGFACGLLLAAIQSFGEELFATAFLDDQSWKTDQADRFYWDAESEVFHARMENAVPAYEPNRYCVLRTQLDPRKSFELEWCVFIHDLAVNGFCSFGLYSADLLNRNMTSQSYPRRLSASTLNMGFSGYGSSGFGLRIALIDDDEDDHGFGGYSSGGRSTYVGRWLHCVMTYDGSSHEMRYAVTDTESGSVLRNGTRTGDTFDSGMVYLGMSQNPVGQPGTGIYENPADAAIIEIDNIALRGEVAPPPHLKQAGGATWESDLLLGSTNPDDTIARYGCFLSSTAMLLQHFGHGVDPGSLNVFLASHSPQVDGFLRFGMIPDDVSSYGQTDGWESVPVRFLHASFPSEATRDAIVTTIRQVISKSGPVILRVPQYGDGMEHYPAWQHAILAWQVAAGTVFVRDPGSSRSGLPAERDIDSLTLDDYVDYVRSSVAVQYQPDTSWEFLQQTEYTYAEAIGVRSDPLIIGSVNSPVEIVVTAPDGTRLGRDPHSGTNYTTLAYGEIVRAAGIITPDGTPMAVPDHFPADISIGNVSTGQYIVDVYGTGTGPWSLDLQVTGSGVSTSLLYAFTGTASAVSHETFAFDVTLPPQPVPPTLSIARNAETNALVLLWQGVSSNRYLARRSYDLSDWRTISTEAITGNNETISFPLPRTQSNASFYSVEALRITEREN
ncbi:MAG: hypothetical protein HN341_05115 [Verrucomicrobia bacterium]|nr:hypothetical protein [Verrucomicrobiota bacterium]